MYQDTRNVVARLKTLAYSMIDDSDNKIIMRGEELLEIAHTIVGHTLHGSFPYPYVMRDLADFCEAQNISYAVIGAVAVSVWGQSRSTEDIDVLVDRMPDQTETFNREYMERFHFYRSRSQTGKMQTFDHKREGQVEILLADTDLRKAALKNAVPVQVLGMSVPVITADYLVITKAVASAANPKRISRDAPDILSVLKKSAPDLTNALVHADAATRAFLRTEFPQLNL